nr:reverse transcriptase domain-containing protein [Tanacetum cinerariifolium]
VTWGGRAKGVGTVQRTVNVVASRENVGSKVVQQSGIQCFNGNEYRHFAKECKKPKRVKDFAYHKEKMLLCKQAEQGVPLQAEQYDWLVDKDEEVDEQELEAHYSYMAKIQEVPTVDSGIDSEPVEQTMMMSVLIANLKLDVDENKKTQKHLKKANTTLAQELKEYKAILAETSQVKKKMKVITDLKLREEHYIEKMLSMEKQLKFLNEVVYKRSQSIQTIHMMAPKVPTYNGRPTSANPRYLKQAQSRISCLYAFPYDQSTHANRLIPDGEETIALERESRSKLKKDLYVESLKKEIDELAYDKAEFSDMHDVILQECVSKDVMCSYLISLSDLDALDELQCLYLHKVKECDCLAQKLSKQTESVCKKVHTELLQCFVKVDKHLITLELALEKCKEQGKSVDTKFDTPSIVRQPNAQRIPKPSVLGKPTPFSDSPERKYFPKTKSVPKANVLEGLSKPVTAQTLPQTAKKAEDPPPESPMADKRTMAELLQAPTEGYEDAIVIPEITANNFELKHGRIWLEKEPPRSIQTWDDLVSKFINQFFPHSKTKNLRNEITRFQQRFDESFYEAWERFNDLLKACPHHGFSELHQLDTFYNALNVNDQDSLNSAAGGNFLDKMPRECLKTIERKYKVRQSRAKAVVAKVGTSSSTPAISSDVAELKDMVKALLLEKKNQSQLQLHLPLLLQSKQSSQTVQGQSTQNQCQNIQNQCQNLQNKMVTLTDMMSKLVSANTASSSGSGTLPGNTITNPKEELKGITTRSSVAYQGPKTPSPSKQGTKVTKDQVQTPSSQNTAPVQPSVTQSESQASVSEPVVALVSVPMPNLKPSIPYPSRRDNEKRRDQANKQIEKFYEIFKEMSFEISFTDALILMPKCASTLKALIGNKEKLSEMARKMMNEHCSAVILNKLPRKLGDPGKFLIPCEFSGMDECLALVDLGASINLMPLSVWEGLSLPELTPTCMMLELTDRSVSKPIGITKDVSFKVGVFHFPADFVVVDFEPDPRVPLILGSFTKALILMPKFASTLKALIRNKEKLSEMDRTTRNEHCSAVILNKLPRKLGDPGKFLIPCEFSGMDECLALADLGASINLMLLSVWEGLLLPELTPTCMTLELADRSVSKPIGIAKDVSFKVGVFHFPADFVVVDFEPDPRVPLILGRCFLKTSRALIYVLKGKLTLRIENEAITYNLDQTVRYSANYNQITANKIDVIESAREEYSQEFFPPSKTTNLRNEITGFQQRFDESFYEAWDRFNDLIRACPHNGFSELHQLNTFYNALNVNDQDSLNSAAGGNFLDKMPRECLKIIKNKSKVRQSRAKAVVAKVSTSSSTPAVSSEVSELKDMVRALLLDKKNQSSALAQSSTPALVKAIEQNCVTCGGAHSYQNCPVTSENVYRDNPRGGNFNQGQLHRPQVNQAPAYQAPAYQAPIPQTQSMTQTDFEGYIKANDAVLRNMQSQGSGTLPSNTITNPKEDLKGITTRTGVAYQGPTIPTQSKVVKQGTEVTKDQVKTPSSQSTTPVQPLVIRFETQTPVSETVVAPVSVPMPNLKSSIPYPSRRDNERHHDQANEQIEKFYEIFKDMSFEISFTDALILMPKFASTLKALIGNKEKLSEMARTSMNEHCSANEAITYNLDQTMRYSANYNQMTANKIDVIYEMYSQEIISFPDVTASGNPTPYDDLIVSTMSPTLTPFGDSDFLLFEDADTFLGLEDDPNSLEFNPFYYDPEGDILLLEAIMNSEPLPPLPNHKQYMPSYKKELKVYEAKTVKSSVDEPPEVKLKDLPPHLEYVFLEGDNKLPVIIAKELGDEEKSALIKVLKSHNPWVSPIHYVPKKGSFTIVENEENELIPTRLVTGWRKLHSPVPTERLPIDACPSVCAMHGARSKVAKVDVIAKLPHPTMVKENLAADYLSRLENPYENVLDPKEINETFPLKTLSMVTFCGDSSAPWFADFANYHAGNFIVKAKALPTNDARVVCKFLKSLFTRFGSPRAIISDRGTHFCNDQFAKAMLKYGVTHRLFTAYHPQTSGQVEVSNRSLKRILERTVGENRAFWLDKLDDALWAFRTAYKTPIRCTPYKLVYGMACHISIELEHKASWALKQANFDLVVAGDHQKVQLNEFNEIRDHAYENSLIYKEKTKRIHDSKIKNRVFNVGDRVLLFNSRLNIFSGKLKTHWSEPFTIAKVFPYGTVELSQVNGPNFKVNGHRVKHYFGGDVPQLVVPNLQTFLMDQ